MANVKGSRIIPRLQYIQKNDPGGIWDKIVSELEPEFSHVIRTGVVSSQWYPLNYYIHLHQLMDKYLGRGDKKLIWKLGNLSAHEAFSGIYRMFFKIGSAEFAIASGALIWKQMYNSGKLRVVNENTADHYQYRFIIEDFDMPAEEIWLISAGWIEGAFEVSGVFDTTTEICKTRVFPNSSCEIVVTRPKKV